MTTRARASSWPATEQCACAAWWLRSASMPRARAWMTSKSSSRGSEASTKAPPDARQNATLFDWWITPLGEGEPVATGFLAALRSHGLIDFTVPDAWVAGDRVLFSVQRGDSRNIWQIAV